MNKLKRSTFKTRIKDAIRAFKGEEFSGLYFGMLFKHCKECDYYPQPWRDNLLVTAGARAAYMHDKGLIDIPGYLAGEDELGDYISSQVDWYLKCLDDAPFDEFIENSLLWHYGIEPEGENDGQITNNDDSRGAECSQGS